MGKVRKFFTYNTNFSQNQKFERLWENSNTAVGPRSRHVDHNIDKKINLKLINKYYYFCCFRG